MSNSRPYVIDLWKSKKIVINVKQLDSDRSIVFQIKSDGIIENLTGKSAKYYVKKPDGTEIFNDCVVYDAVNGIIHCNLTEQVLIDNVTLTMELLIVSGTGQTSSFPITLLITETIIDPAAIESSDEFNALVTALASVVNIDNRFNGKVGKGELIFNVKDYGAIGNDTADDTANIQNALNTVKVTGGTLLFPPGVYKITNTLTWDVAKVSLEFQGSTIHPVITDSSKYAISTVSSAPGNPYDQVMTHLKGLRLSGNDVCKGIKFDGGVGNPGASHITIEKCSIGHFATGVTFSDHAYCITFSNCDLLYCSTIVDIPTASDAGERISFTNCTLYNSTLVLNQNNPNSDVYFNNCSIDYNTKVATITQGRTFFTNCHIEGSYGITQRQFVLNSLGSLVVRGGWLQFAGGATTGTDYILENNANAKVKVLFDGVSMNNCKTTSGRFATGSGKTVFKNINLLNTDEMPSIINTTDNLMLDGSFEGSSVLDNIYVVADTLTITGKPLTGQNMNLSLSSTTARTGSKSLKANKTYGSGSNCAFNIICPISRYSTPGIELWYKKGGGSGSFDIYVDVAKYEDGVVKNQTRIDTASITVDSLDTVNWNKYAIGTTRPSVPSWANCIVITVNMFLYNGSNNAIYFDDITINEM